MDSTIAGRITAYLTEKRISIAQASRDTGIQYDTLQQILYGRVKAMGVDKFAAIWQAYPDMDGWYILTGQTAAERAKSITTDQLNSLRADVLRIFDTVLNESGG